VLFLGLAAWQELLRLFKVRPHHFLEQIIKFHTIHLPHSEERNFSLKNRTHIYLALIISRSRRFMQKKHTTRYIIFKATRKSDCTSFLCVPSLRLRARGVHRQPVITLIFLRPHLVYFSIALREKQVEKSRCVLSREHNTIIYRVEKSIVAENKTLPKRALAPEQSVYFI
jgi:hypothetical protein